MDTQAAQTLVYTVSELNREVKSLLHEAFPPIWVEGEISNLKQHSSGHWYFCLKDERAQINCAMFRINNSTVRFKPKDGLKVKALARVTLYEERGNFQLVVEHLEEDGHGQLQRAFEALKLKLAAEGLFDEERKKELPNLPKQIGVITSPTGAAIRDILSVLKRRFASIPVIVYPTAVQGNEACGQIVKAIQLANQRKECDILILARGGGSIEDLWSFNEEAVARAIFTSEIPIVSGVGHEIDFTIADFVADARAPTPSVAAEMVTPDRTEYANCLKQLILRIHRGLKNLLQHHNVSLNHLHKRLRHPKLQLFDLAQRLDNLEQRLFMAQSHELRHRQAKLNHVIEKLLRHTPNFQIEAKKSQNQYLYNRLTQTMQHFLFKQQQSTQQLMRALNAISPLNILDRGYAIIQKDQIVLRQSAQVQIGDTIKARLHQGELICEVKNVLTNEPSACITEIDTAIV